MKETYFIKLYSQQWKEAEQLLKLKRGSVDPDKIARYYTQISDDLSYAATFYPQSSTTHYLNSLASSFHRLIYSRKYEKRSRLITFWTREQPRLVYRYRYSMLVALLFFAVSAFLGILSSHYDKMFARIVMGETYMRMTELNIQNGDPLAVYKQAHEITMFLGITVNNIRVALSAFALGTVFSAGTSVLLFFNGVMIGTFHYFFYENGLLFESLKTVWIHGTLEISAIIISAGAGMIIGNSILFPGTYKRLVSFQKGASDGIKVLIGVIPLFIVAGFLEGFVTRHTELPDYIRVGIILICFVFIILYYFVYPIIVNRRQK
ncbi:MAG: stage II sporulation protein M [Spirochaetes bacterium]|nr:stage II sporulation protein M [Spirochaetota bacterium]MBN2769184.1 stage II sporulation protein M [Spirochaetota bacterium]